jgi:hypothetical protein
VPSPRRKAIVGYAVEKLNLRKFLRFLRALGRDRQHPLLPAEMIAR